VFSNTLLENTRGGLLAGIGIALLFWAVIKMLGNIEKSFNDIWGVRQERSMGRKFSDYLSLMLICPILIIMSGSLTVFITTQVTLITEKVALLGYLGPIIFTSLNILSYAVIWILLTFIYSFMPNMKIPLSSALVGGIIAGTLYKIVQFGYIHFQVGVSKYNAIYGSFAALPLFLVWLQISWLIVLFGSEIAFAHHNEETYEFEADAKEASPGFRKLLSLRVAHLCFKRFSEAKGPWTAADIANTLEAPVRLVRHVLGDLVKANILSETHAEADDRTRQYQPARSVDHMTVKDVLDSLDHAGLNDLPHMESKELEKIRECLLEMDKDLEKSKSNPILKDL